MNRKIEFLQILRGGAAVSVLLSHLLVMFWGGVENGTISNIFPYLSEGYTCAPVVVGAIRITRLFSQIQFDLGAYGVSVFFLISGFVVSMSLERRKQLDISGGVKVLFCYVYYFLFSEGA